MKAPTPQIWLDGPPTAWDISVRDLAEQLSGDAQKIILLDARPELDWQEGTIPGARSLSVQAITVDAGRAQPVTKALINDILAAPRDISIVFFANTGAPATDGIQRGRDWWVMTAMLELGLPHSRMLRLEGGLNAWRTAGHHVVPKGLVPGVRRFADLGTLLTHLELMHVQPSLEEHFGGISDVVRALADSGRAAFIKQLHAAGMASLKERQALAGGLARAQREGALDF